MHKYGKLLLLIVRVVAILIKILPISFKDTTKCQKYFSQMSRKGYHLKEVLPPFAKFIKGQPEEYEYRIRLLSNFIGVFHARLYHVTLPDKEKVDELSRMGWKKIYRRKKIYIYRGIKNQINGEVSIGDDEKSRFRLMMLDDWSHHVSSPLFLITGLLSLFIIKDNGLVNSIVQRGFPVILVYVVCIWSSIGTVRGILFDKWLKNKWDITKDENMLSYKLRRRTVLSWLIRITIVVILIILYVTT